MSSLSTCFKFIQYILNLAKFNTIYYIQLFRNTKCFLNIILILLIIGFFSLAERIFLAICQFRSGPKNPILGLGLVPLDGIKLYSKIGSYLASGILIIGIGSSLIIIISALLLWISGYRNILFVENDLLFSLIILSLLGILFFIPFLTSNSKFMLLGLFRNLNQFLVADIILETSIFLSFTILNFNGYGNIYQNSDKCSIYLLLCLLPIVGITILFNSGKSPFDFPESESEIVSGISTEYGSIIFSLSLLTEYCELLFFS